MVQTVELKGITFLIKAGVALSFSNNALRFILPLLADGTHYFL